MDKKYTKPVSITVDEQSYDWTPRDGLLADKDDFTANANQQVMDLFMMDLVDAYGEKFPAAPEGPFLPTTTQDLYTTVYLLNTLFADSEIDIDGDAPTMRDMGLAGPRFINGEQLID